MLPDGAAGLYLGRLLDDGEAKVRVAALAALGFHDVVEASAVDLITAWRTEHSTTVATLPVSIRSAIQPLWALQPDDMIAAEIELPRVRREATQKIQGSTLAPIDTFAHHLYVISRGEHVDRFPVVTTSWERGVLDHELAQPSLVGWYRNPASGRHALAIPYRYGDSFNLLHPDFLFFHDDDGTIVVDIVDPHLHTDSATAEKWAALARYAQMNAGSVRRAVAVIADPAGKLRALDLTVPGVEDKLVAAGDGAQIMALFDSDGVDYP